VSSGSAPPRTIRLDLAYDGTGFHGWARQRDPAIRTIEGELGAVLERVLRHDIRLSVAGRTDAGVHAAGQVASFATGSPVSPEKIQAAVNGGLMPEVVVRRAVVAPDGFDARFSAVAREYRYAIDVAAWPDPFTARWTWDRPGSLSLSPMRTAARMLVGEHDFASFCRHPGVGRSTVRDLRRLSIARTGERFELRFRANAFLHQMVRALVGTLVAVGEGRIEPAAVPAILRRRDRAGTPPVAPPHGLTLERVVYRGGAPGSTT
jgi:tRNA pseudouridine38-40 synthase